MQIKHILLLFFILIPFAVQSDEKGLIVRQIVGQDGSASLVVVLDGQDVTSSYASRLTMMETQPLRHYKDKIAAKAVDEGYIRSFENIFAPSVRGLLTFLGLNGAVIQMEQQVKIWSGVEGSVDDGLLVISGYVNSNFGGSGVVHGGVRVSRSNPTYIAARYYPTDPVDIQNLDDETQELFTGLIATITTELSDALVYQVYDLQTHTPVSDEITLRGYGIDINNAPSVALAQSATVRIDSAAVIKCLAGVNLPDIERKYSPQHTKNWWNVHITQTECPQHQWRGHEKGAAAGAPQTIENLLLRTSSEYALLQENAALSPVWEINDNGEQMPAMREVLSKRNIHYSCYFGQYSETYKEVLALESAENLYIVRTFPDLSVLPAGSVKGSTPPLELVLNETTVTASYFDRDGKVPYVKVASQLWNGGNVRKERMLGRFGESQKIYSVSPANISLQFAITMQSDAHLVSMASAYQTSLGRYTRRSEEYAAAVDVLATLQLAKEWVDYRGIIYHRSVLIPIPADAENIPPLSFSYGEPLEWETTCAANHHDKNQMVFRLNGITGVAVNRRCTIGRDGSCRNVGSFRLGSIIGVIGTNNDGRRCVKSGCTCSGNCSSGKTWQNKITFPDENIFPLLLESTGTYSNCRDGGGACGPGSR